jgi:hypothetical protein
MQSSRSNSRRFWLGWGVAFLGFPLAGLVGQALTQGVTTPLGGAVAGAASGAVLGATQWLVLRQRLPLSLLWPLVTAIGMGTGLALGVALFGTSIETGPLLGRALVTGAAIGAAQLALLFPLSSRAWIWLPTLIVGWPLGWLITRAVGVDLSPNWSIFGSTGAWAFQLLTGLALAWMFWQNSGVRTQNSEGRTH